MHVTMRMHHILLAKQTEESPIDLTVTKHMSKTPDPRQDIVPWVGLTNCKLPRLPEELLVECLGQQGVDLNIPVRDEPPELLVTEQVRRRWSCCC